MNKTTHYLGQFLVIIGVVSVAAGFFNDLIGLMVSGLIPLFAGGFIMKKWGIKK
ncbi:hypothetical protein ACFLQN_04455 [Candidatus Aenigmatarchaeota archaeon]